MLFNSWCYLSMVLCTYIYSLSAVYYLWCWFPVTHDISSTVTVVSTAFTASVGTLKFLYVLISRKELTETIDEYRRVDANWKPDSEHMLRVQALLLNVKMRCVVCLLSFVANGIFFTTKPLFFSQTYFPIDEVEIWGLHPKLETPNYQIAYTIIVIATHMGFLAPAAVTILFIFLSSYVEVHITELAEDFRLLWTDSSEEFQRNEDNYLAKAQPVRITRRSADDVDTSNLRAKYLNDIVTHRLHDLIGKHADLLQLFHTVNVLFKRIIFIEFGMAVLALCACFLGDAQNTPCTVLYTSTPLFVNCLLGQMVTNAGYKLKENIYGCGWENFSISNKKSIILVLQRSQRDLVLTAGGIMDLSCESFTSIVNTIYSAQAAFRAKL